MNDKQIERNMQRYVFHIQRSIEGWKYFINVARHQLAPHDANELLETNQSATQPQNGINNSLQKSRSSTTHNKKEK